jgi:glycosidase
MKIIIDGVFNHTGVQFWAFQDIIKNGVNSKYKDWYLIKSFDDINTPQNEFDYKGWWGTKSLPEFNRTANDLNRGPKQYIFHSTLRWMDPNNDGDPSDGIDGWRLDVAREVPIGFWKDWNKLVKSINPSSIIVGELWELSPDYISENGVFDALMNYNFAFTVNGFFIADKNQIKVSEFINKLKEIDATYPEEYLYLLQNLLDSHDTERLSSMIVNPDRKYDHDSNEGNPNYSPAKPRTSNYEKQKLIAVFQMTYRGAPMIYYGDEVGMWGADDPHDRKPMIWEELDYDDEVITKKSGFKTGFGKYEVKPNNELKMFYKNLIHLRNSNSAFRTGTINFLYFNDAKRTFVFERKENYKRFLVAFNLGDQSDKIKIPISESKIYFEEMLSGEKGMFSSDGVKGIEFETTLMPQSASIYKIQTAY